MKKWGQRTAALLVIAALCASVSVLCRRKPEHGRPNIVLITIDALRPDHLQFYGYERNTAPFLNSLAERAWVFENAYSPSSWTAPAMASLFTSLYPRSHAVRHGIVADKEIQMQEVLSVSYQTLAERLKESGYSTYGFSSNPHISEQLGMAQGFDHFVSKWFCKASDIHNELRLVKTDLQKTEPFFLWVHYFDPHMPYYAKEPWISDFASHPEHVREWKGRLLRWIEARKDRVESHPALLQTLRDLYDSEISHTDEFIRRLFADVLPARDNTLVIVTSDHGEQFLEHGDVGHARSLYQEEIRIPMIVQLPGMQGDTNSLRIAKPVSLLDVYPTALAVAGIGIPDHCQGASMLPMASRDTATSERTTFAELDRGQALRAVIMNDWKLISNLPESSRALYNLADDPQEENDLSDSAPAKVELLLKETVRWATAPYVSSHTGDVTISVEQARRLRSMGYTR